jgi:hypothetical protein
VDWDGPGETLATAETVADGLTELRGEATALGPVLAQPVSKTARIKRKARMFL